MRFRRLFALCGFLFFACSAYTPVLEKSAQQRVLRVGFSVDYAPFSQRDASGRYSGFAVELLETYARDRNLRLEARDFAWPSLLEDIRAQRFDVAASGISVRPERSILAQYTVPIAQTGTMVLTPKVFPSAQAMLDSLNASGVRLGVNRGGHLEHTTRRLFPNASVITYPDNRLVPKALREGEVDAVVTNDIEAPHFQEVVGDAHAYGPLTREDVALLLPSGASDLTSDLDTWLMQAERTGRLGSLRRKYLPESARTKTAEPLRALLSASAERLSLMPFVAEAKRIAGRAIDDPAQEAKVIAATQKGVEDLAKKTHVTPPSPRAIEAFVRAQIELAKAVQTRSPPGAVGAAFDLDTELRPAISRVSARMQALLLGLPSDCDEEMLVEAARFVLGAVGATRAETDTMAHAICAVARNEPQP